MPSRDAIISAARSWVGTPYLHQASVKGVGADCLGVVRGVYRDLYGAEPEQTPPYTADWAEARGQETLRDAAMRHLTPIAKSARQPGDVLLFRMLPKNPAKHAAIQVTDHHMVHAYSGHAVMEGILTDWWERRLVYVFRFPEGRN